MIVWGRAEDIRREVADVPAGWLRRFAKGRPGDVRKLGDAQCSTLLFRVSAVLDAIANGEFKRAYNYGKEVSAADIRAEAIQK